MRALTFAARNLLRQPARAWLGVLGVAAVGALLFDMLLLSNGLVISMEQMLTTTGFDIRAGIGMMVPGSGQLIEDAGALADRLRALPEVAEATPVRFADGLLARTPRPLGVRVMGAAGRGRPTWTLMRGRDLTGAPGEALVNQRVLDVMKTRIGGTLDVRTFTRDTRTVAPAERFTIVGLAEFPFESERGTTIGLSLADVDRVAGGTAPKRSTNRPCQFFIIIFILESIN